MKSFKQALVLSIISVACGYAAPQQPSTDYTSRPEPCPCPEDYFRKDEKAIFASAEFLWWTVEEDATDFALKNTKIIPAGPVVPFPQGRYQIAEFDWDPGYRLTLGYFNAPRFWEVYAQYAWLYSSGTDSVNAPSAIDLLLVPTLGTIANPILLFTRATSKIGFHYHLGDLMTGRVFFPNPHLRLKLIGGLTGTWIKQNWRVRYTGESIDDFNIERIRNKWRYVGIGLRIGLSMDWYLGADFYLTGRWSTAVLVGRYRNWYTQKILTDETQFRDTTYKDYRPAVTSQFLLGPSYQKNFNCARLEIFAGYELTPWFNLQENYRGTIGASSAGGMGASPVITHNRSLILLHGLTTRVTVDF